MRFASAASRSLIGLRTGGLGRHVADHVAAGAQRGDHGLVDLGDRGFQVALDDAVELDRLTSQVASP